MNEFEKTVNDYLDDFEKTDAVFKAKRSDSKKTVEDCCAYISTEVRESGRHAFADGEIYQMARHFYDEDIPSPEKCNGCRVVHTKPKEAAKPKKKGDSLAVQLSLFGEESI